jgi:uncharacterized protein (DUF779 family)
VDLRFTERARALLAEIRAENPSDVLVILVGGGCCENTAPILMKNFRVGRSDRLMGEGKGSASTPRRMSTPSSRGRLP